MYKDLWRQRPLLTLPQILILLLVGAALFVAVDLNRRAQAGQLVGVGEGDLQVEVDAESTRQVELQVTLAYVQSEDYVAAYARDSAECTRLLVGIHLAGTPTEGVGGGAAGGDGTGYVGGVVAGASGALVAV